MGSSIWFIGYKIMRVNFLLPYLQDLRPKLLKSGLRVSLEAYASTIVFFSILASIISFIISLIIGFIYNLPFWLNILFGIASSILGYATVFIVFYTYPSIKVNSLARRINEELPFAVGHMAVLAASGATPESIFRSLAEAAPRDAIGEFCKLIIRDISLFGKDLVTSLELAKERSPSRSLTEFLDELIAVIRRGGDLRAFLTSQATSLLAAREIAAREFSETLSTLAEFYVILLVVFPLFILIMFSMMALITRTILGISIEMLASYVTYILIPLLGIAFLIALDAIMPRGE
ncbi:MAG: type II secretion system F family protein [Nitrososphaerota archaeon]|nr:type II secretion system F family protein [Nitrososphaerota archaeon]